MLITSATAGSCLMIASTCLVTSSTRSWDAPDGRSIATIIVPLSSSGTKPPGIVLNSMIREPMITA